MKTNIQCLLSSAVFAAAMTWLGTASAQFYQGETESHSVLTINADGSCLLTTATVEPRPAAEQQLRMVERYQNAAENGGEETTPPDTNPPATNGVAEPAPFTDEELTKKLTDQMDENADNAGEDAAGQKSTVEVKKDTVNIISSQTFASIEEMLKASYGIWERGGLYVENVRAETDTNGLLRLTFTPRTGITRYLKNARAEWKLSGAKSDLKLVFPGKVVSSGFPATETNATWLVVDGKNDESLDALLKLNAAPTVITAEAAGLKLDQPLESKTLVRTRRQSGAEGDDLPITDAGPGFAAEAQSVTTTTLHVFPGGEDYFNQNSAGGGSSTGAVVTAKLFAPKGRTLQSVSDVRVLTAVDDKGRSIVAEPADDENSYTTYSGDSQDAGSMQVQLHLGLPEPDAQSIDVVTAEAVAITAGTWKEMTLTNLQENATNELDLAAVLPGAKLVILKNSTKEGQINLQVRLKGPRTVSHLEVRAKIPGNDEFNSNSSDRNSRTTGGETTRNLMIQGYGFSDNGPASTGAAVLVIRYPEDLQRERVKFELKSLDLL